ncbi:MAG: hypothetical protein K9M80_09355 [Candidatus Marinimicrobia bacterium]|nr:hypothetical protein [Candidatus Neomarinimicrobiota bacterium]
MNSDLGTIAIVLIIFGSIVITIRLLLQGRLWKKLIENNMVNENMDLPNLESFDNYKLSWLKWGIVIIAFSLSLIIINVIPAELSDVLKIGISGIFIGIAFIISYFISVNSNT